LSFGPQSNRHEHEQTKCNAGPLLSSIRIDREAERKTSIQLYMGLNDILQEDKKAAFTAAFTEAGVTDLQPSENVPPGNEDAEGPALRKIEGRL